MRRRKTRRVNRRFNGFKWKALERQLVRKWKWSGNKTKEVSREGGESIIDMKVQPKRRSYVRAMHSKMKNNEVFRLKLFVLMLTENHTGR